MKEVKIYIYRDGSSIVADQNTKKINLFIENKFYTQMHRYESVALRIITNGREYDKALLELKNDYGKTCKIETSLTCKEVREMDLSKNTQLTIGVPIEPWNFKDSLPFLWEEVKDRY